MADFSTLQERLEYILAEKRMRASELAEGTGLAPGLISKWLNGQITKPKRETLEKVAAFLQVDLDWLYRGGNVKVLENGEDPDDDFVQIKEYNVIIGAGEAYEPSFEEVEDAVPATYRRDFFKRHGVKPENCKRLKVKGNSMEPLILDGDHITVDCTPNQKVIDGRIYVLFFRDTLRVKRLSLPVKGGLILKSENKDYDDVFLPEDEAAQVQIIGRVIDRSGCIR